MRTALLYAALFAVPPAVALGIGVTLLTGQVLFGVTACVIIGLLFATVVLLGAEVGSPDEEMAE